MSQYIFQQLLFMIQYTLHIQKTPTCFSTQVPNSRIYYNKGVQASLLIYVLFLVTSVIKTLFVKIHKMYKMCKIDIVDNLQCFDYILIVSRHGNCQLLV